MVETKRGMKLDYTKAPKLFYHPLYNIHLIPNNMSKIKSFIELYIHQRVIIVKLIAIVNERICILSLDDNPRKAI